MPKSRERQYIFSVTEETTMTVAVMATSQRKAENKLYDAADDGQIYDGDNYVGTHSEYTGHQLLEVK
jgi:hypothetical protein